MTEPTEVDWRDYLETNPRVQDGKPVVKGTTLTAEFLLGLLAQGSTTRQLLDRYPQLSAEALRAVFELAVESVHRKHPPKTPDEFFEGPEWTEVAPGVRMRKLPE
jgi:uncharacterized protein (DUF433 family)